MTTLSSPLTDTSGSVLEQLVQDLGTRRSCTRMGRRFLSDASAPTTEWSGPSDYYEYFSISWRF